MCPQNKTPRKYVSTELETRVDPKSIHIRTEWLVNKYIRNENEKKNQLQQFISIKKRKNTCTVKQKLMCFLKCKKLVFNAVKF